LAPFNLTDKKPASRLAQLLVSLEDGGWQSLADGLPAGTDIAPAVVSIQVVFLWNPLFLQQWSYFNLSVKVAKFVKVNGWRYYFEYRNGGRKARV